MESENNVVISNRSELIKRARESCSGNLSSSHGKNANGRQLKSGREQSDDRVINEHYRTTTNMLTKPASIKLFMIRVTLAVVLFLFIVAVDQFKLNYNGIGSETIKDYIVSNESVSKAVDFVSSIASSFASNFASK